MKRLFLLMVFLAVSVQSDAAKMSSYTENSTPNGDVYFIGVDPNDTTQTVNGSNYRYPLSVVLGSGLLDANFRSLTVSGTGDSWLELGNNASFTDVLTGKGGYGLLNWLPYAILNGEQKRLALFEELAAGDTSIIQDNDPTLASATGKYYSRASGGYFNVVHGVEMFTIAGTRTADETDPVIGTITPSALTHDGTGVSLSTTVASVTETYENYRQWSLYDVTDAAIQIDWSTFTGLSIPTILIPADQHEYRVDVRAYDLAGNVGSASSVGIVYSGGAIYIIEEDFEATGYDMLPEPTASPGTTTIDPDYAGTVLNGSQSLRMYGGTDASRVQYTLGTDMASGRYHVLLRIATMPTTGIVIFRTYDIGLGATFVVNLEATGRLNSTANGGTTDYGSTLSLNTTYHLWIDFAKGTGSNAVLTTSLSTDKNYPATPDMTITNSTITTDVHYVRAFCSGFGADILFDQGLLSEYAFTSVP